MTLNLDKHDEEYRQFKMKKTNNWKVFGIVVILLALTGALYYGAWAIRNDAYDVGVSYGSSYTLGYIASSQTQSGNIIITNGTAITTMPITQICKNLIDAQEVKQ